MRKPRQHDIFQVKREPGLSDLLVGQAKAADVMRKTGSEQIGRQMAARKDYANYYASTETKT